MKCTCKECGGTGLVACPECEWRGEYHGKIEDIRLERSIRNYDELSELQEDAKRAIRQTARLRAMKPHRAESYEAQLRATLFVINGEAEQLDRA